MNNCNFNSRKLSPLFPTISQIMNFLKGTRLSPYFLHFYTSIYSFSIFLLFSILFALGFIISQFCFLYLLVPCTCFVSIGICSIENLKPSYLIHSQHNGIRTIRQSMPHPVRLVLLIQEASIRNIMVVHYFLLS